MATSAFISTTVIKNNIFPKGETKHYFLCEMSFLIGERSPWIWYHNTVNCPVPYSGYSTQPCLQMHKDLHNFLLFSKHPILPQISIHHSLKLNPHPIYVCILIYIHVKLWTSTTQPSCILLHYTDDGSTKKLPPVSQFCSHSYLSFFSHFATSFIR